MSPASGFQDRPDFNLQFRSNSKLDKIKHRPKGILKLSTQEQIKFEKQELAVKVQTHHPHRNILTQFQTHFQSEASTPILRGEAIKPQESTDAEVR